MVRTIPRKDRPPEWNCCQGRSVVVGVIDRYLTRQILLASVVAVAVVVGPVILISLISHLGEDALYTSLVWPALASTGPMILFHVLPALVAIAIVWSYGRFAADGILIVIYSSGRSTFAARLPGFAVAFAAVVLGYLLTCWVVPLTSGHLHDVLFSLRRGVNPALLKVGVFNQFDHGRQVFYFRNYIKGNELADVFVRQAMSDDEERVYKARYAVFERQGDESGIVLLDGTVQSLRSGRSEVRSVAYTRIFVPLNEYGFGGVKRDYTIIDEVPLQDFLDGRSKAMADPGTAREWIHEALNRLGIPLLALLHTWLGLELLPVWRSLGDRRGPRAWLVCAAIGALHFFMVLTIEQTLVDLRTTWAVGGLLLAELALALILALRRRGGAMAAPSATPAVSMRLGMTGVPALHAGLALWDGGAAALVNGPHDELPNAIAPPCP
ncbi:MULTISPECIES: LptF/LptG family permease [unclassified Bradyrhizobium]|uniref:LptF/LptG family permease n=1 Tax=unclassified Bradyrhizobium TaxID=2631580 RepID=UPI0029170298|nr:MULTISPECIES: LptF/LptG family permease [unclassified Bradyrhizobium]